VPIALVIVFATAGAFMGDSTSWFIGHRWGTSLITRWEPIHRHLAGPLARAELHFDRHGGPTVFGARFVGPLRALIPLVAGTSGMTYRRFVPWNAMASVIWVTIVIALGAIFGETIASIIDRFGLIATGLLILVLVGLFIRHRARRSAAETESS
jgi:undecaprenyl-diphosphatase